MTENKDIIARLQAHLSSLRKQYPDIWREIDYYRTGFMPAFTWPKWCFMPMAGYLAIVTGGRPDFHDLPLDVQLRLIKGAQQLAALAPWRLTQGVYRFHPELGKEIASSELSGDLPTSLFYHLPEWSVYIHWEKTLTDRACYGFFAHLEWDANHNRPELRLLVDSEEDLVPVPVHLNAGSILEALEAVVRQAESNAELYVFRGRPAANNLVEKIHSLITRSELIGQMVSLVLYLCSVNADIYDPRQPSRSPGISRAKKVKGGILRYFPADKPTFWQVAYRLGETVARLRGKTDAPAGGTHASPQPHIRRAHWHSYWVGPRKDPEKRRKVVRWLHPILVAGQGRINGKERHIQGGQGTDDR